MKKRFLLLVMTAVMSFSLVACGSKEDTDTKSKTEADATEKTDNKKEENQDKKEDKEDKDSAKEDKKDADDKEADQADMTYEEFLKMEESPAEDFYVYEESEGVVAVKYTGTDKYVSVPAEIDGKKITKLGTSTGFYMTSSSEESLKGLKLPDTITCIEKNAVMGNSQLEYLILNENLEEIGELAFMKCESLEVLVLPDGLLKIDEGAFYSTGLKELTIPTSVTFIGDEAFGDTENLENIYFENGNCEMEEDVFGVDSRLEKVTVHAAAGSKVEEHVKLMIEDGFEEVIGFEAK